VAIRVTVYAKNRDKACLQIQLVKFLEQFFFVLSAQAAFEHTFLQTKAESFEHFVHSAAFPVAAYIVCRNKISVVTHFYLPSSGKIAAIHYRPPIGEYCEPAPPLLQPEKIDADEEKFGIYSLFSKSKSGVVGSKLKRRKF
jgi:hypothetical protein